MAKQTSVYAFGVLALLIALLVPAAIAVTDSPARGAFDLAENETQVVSQTLQVHLEEVQPDMSATITLRDSETLASETQTIDEGNMSTYTIRGETVNVTVIEADQQSAETSIQYPRTYGWHADASLFIDNLPFILVVAFAIVVVGMVVALKP